MDVDFQQKKIVSRKKERKEKEGWMQISRKKELEWKECSKGTGGGNGWRFWFVYRENSLLEQGLQSH